MIFRRGHVWEFQIRCQHWGSSRLAPIMIFGSCAGFFLCWSLVTMDFCWTCLDHRWSKERGLEINACCADWSHLHLQRSFRSDSTVSLGSWQEETGRNRGDLLLEPKLWGGHQIEYHASLRKGSSISTFHGWGGPCGYTLGIFRIWTRSLEVRSVWFPLFHHHAINYIDLPTWHPEEISWATGSFDAARAWCIQRRDTASCLEFGREWSSVSTSVFICLLSFWRIHLRGWRSQK